MQDFLDRCQEAGRQVLEKKIVALRSAAAASLGLDTAQVDTDARIKTLQETARLANQLHEASQRQAVSGLQGALASAEVAIAASEAEGAANALSKQAHGEAAQLIRNPHSIVLRVAESRRGSRIVDDTPALASCAVAALGRLALRVRDM